MIVVGSLTENKRLELAEPPIENQALQGRQSTQGLEGELRPQDGAQHQEVRQQTKEEVRSQKWDVSHNTEGAAEVVSQHRTWRDVIVVWRLTLEIGAELSQGKW